MIQRLDENERELLRGYRALSHKGKMCVLGYVEGATAAEKTIWNDSGSGESETTETD